MVEAIDDDGHIRYLLTIKEDGLPRDHVTQIIRNISRMRDDVSYANFKESVG
ncbi:hypothetical protein HY492_00245 [Candidatus Woesearchaeota archaeon]|nr:hypothetical protein [Candidatus Woesearchaeota archaeon]